MGYVADVLNMIYKRGEIEMKSWEQEMKLDGSMNEQEIEKFLKVIKTLGVPSIEEYAGEKGRDEVAEEYWSKYGDYIKAVRDAVTE